MGLDYAKPIASAKQNGTSAIEHLLVVESYLRSERAEGRMIGLMDSKSVPGLHTNRFGVIPKDHATNRWRLITDLSFPEGTSINDGIRPELCSLTYTSVDRVARAAEQLGPGALLAKVDTYRLVPVHPDERPLLGVAWE